MVVVAERPGLPSLGLAWWGSSRVPSSLVLRPSSPAGIHDQQSWYKIKSMFSCCQLVSAVAQEHCGHEFSSE